MGDWMIIFQLLFSFREIVLFTSQSLSYRVVRYIWELLGFWFLIACTFRVMGKLFDFVPELWSFGCGHCCCLLWMFKVVSFVFFMHIASILFHLKGWWKGTEGKRFYASWDEVPQGCGRSKDQTVTDTGPSEEISGNADQVRPDKMFLETGGWSKQGRSRSDYCIECFISKYWLAINGNGYTLVNRGLFREQILSF